MGVPRRRHYIHRRPKARATGISGVKRRANQRHRTMKGRKPAKVKFIRRHWRVTRSR